MKRELSKLQKREAPRKKLKLSPVGELEDTKGGGTIQDQVMRILVVILKGLIPVLKVTVEDQGAIVDLVVKGFLFLGNATIPLNESVVDLLTLLCQAKAKITPVDILPRCLKSSTVRKAFMSSTARVKLTCLVRSPLSLTVGNKVSSCELICFRFSCHSSAEPKCRHGRPNG